MRYGHFDDERREYVITRPDTPLPWINYLGSEDYFALVSNTAGGYSFYRDARLRRLIRYRYNNAPLDVGGRFLYVRDDDTGDYWNPGWQPTQRELDGYACRHGLGYTVIARRARRHPRRDDLPRAARARRSRCGGRGSPTTGRRRPPVAVRRRGVLPLGRPGRRDELPAQPVHGRGPRRGRRRLPPDRVPRAPRPLRLVRVLRARGGVRDVARGVPRAPTGAGTGRSPWSAARLGGSVAHGWQPVGALQATLELEPG